MNLIRINFELKTINLDFILNEMAVRELRSFFEGRLDDFSLVVFTRNFSLIIVEKNDVSE